MNIIKNNGRIYTPKYIVKNIMQLIGYNSEIILEKHIIDNSCGDGAFLTEIADMYCSIYLSKNFDKQILKKQLEKFIHGIEINIDEQKQCISNLNSVVQKYDIYDVNWDIVCGDTLKINTYNSKMDFVIGNPPYVRVHNLLNSYSDVKKFKFSNSGMTDLFIVFFEIGFNMLNEHGKLGYITPSSFLRSKAGKELRKYIFNKRTLIKVVDLEHFQAFNATTYSLISIFDNNKRSQTIDYYKYDSISKKPLFVEELKYNKIYINGCLYFSCSDDLELLQKIENHFINRNIKTITVKNGFATLADKIFIGKLPFSDYTINVLKASTAKWYDCFFPYNTNGKPVKFSEIEKNIEIKNYLIKNKEQLENRDLENKDNWYLFGRTQAISDVFCDKIVINTTIRDLSSIKISYVPKGKGVFSGLYILSNYDFNKIKNILLSEDFIKYLRTLKNYKSGGYYSFSAIELEKYLCYKIEEVRNEQLGLFESDLAFIH